MDDKDSSSPKCTDTHTQLHSVLFILAQPLASNVDGMFDCPPFVPLRHDVTPTKCNENSETNTLMCVQPQIKKTEGKG